MTKPPSFWTKFHRLHLGLYLLFLLSLAFARAASVIFEQYSMVDFGLARSEFNRAVAAHEKGSGYEVTRGTWLHIFKPIGVKKVETGGRSADGEKDFGYTSEDPTDDLYLLLLLVWLWPLYRHYFSKKRQDPARIERRIIQLPAFIFALGWVLALQRFLVNMHTYSSLYGPVPGRITLVLAASALFFGVLMSYLNLELTGLYIRARIARPFFAETNPYGIKRGFAISLGMRYALMIFSLAAMPLLFALYVPVVLNLDLFSRLAATRESGWDWALSYDYLRIFIPIFLVTALVAVNLVFQLVSILLYRRNVQAPVNALVGRMKRVAAGDFDCKASVLYSDEMGQLKGHFNLMLDGLQERDRIKDTFGRYVSIEIAEKIMKSGKVNLAGEEIQATVLFSDIRDFTPLSEKLPPPELIRFLNDYFAHVTAPITENRGVINKFIGDAVMAIFSPVFGVQDHQAAAARAALGMREALRRFNAQGKYPEVHFGVGLHSGGLVAGNVGTEARLEYTVLGDTVNVASRIESQTKTEGAQILLSEAVLAGLDRAQFPGVTFTACPPVVMKGKSAPMVLYKAGPAA
jgi:class 3 adenylate cyclase